MFSGNVLQLASGFQVPNSHIWILVSVTLIFSISDFDFRLIWVLFGFNVWVWFKFISICGTYWLVVVGSYQPKTASESWSMSGSCGFDLQYIFDGGCGFIMIVAIISICCSYCLSVSDSYCFAHFFSISAKTISENLKPQIILFSLCGFACRFSYLNF